MGEKEGTMSRLEIKLTPQEYFRLQILMKLLQAVEEDPAKSLSAKVAGCGEISWIPGAEVIIELTQGESDG